MPIACDRELRALLPSLDIEVQDGYPPFDPDVQIQPASIDLRLGPVFWIQRLRRRPLDLVKTRLMEVAPRRLWRRKDLYLSQESIVLRPGETIFGSTLESFHIPPNYLGRIYGRSSYARLGLQVHSSGDFINPGWSGRFPLQLTNNGRLPLELRPGIPLCQVSFHQLSGIPDRSYGDSSLASKYMEDDGGPSYWWRDRLIQTALQALEAQDVEASAQAELVKALANPEPDTIERFERYLETKPRHLNDVEGILHGFGAAEKRTRTLDLALTRGSGAIGVVLAGVSASLIVESQVVGAVVFGVLAAIAGLGFVWAHGSRGGRTYFRTE